MVTWTQVGLLVLGAILAAGGGAVTQLVSHSLATRQYQRERNESSGLALADVRWTLGAINPDIYIMSPDTEAVDALVDHLATLNAAVRALEPVRLLHGDPQTREDVGRVIDAVRKAAAHTSIYLATRSDTPAAAARDAYSEAVELVEACAERFRP